MPVEIVVFLSLENGTCAALSTCATPQRRRIVGLPCETSLSLAVARIAASSAMLDPSSLKPPVCPIRPSLSPSASFGLNSYDSWRLYG